MTTEDAVRTQVPVAGQTLLDRQLDVVLAQARAQIAFVDLDLRYTRVSEDYAGAHGLTGPSLLGCRPADVDPVGGAALEEVLRAVLRTSVPVVRVGDGAAGGAPVALRCTPVTSASGATAGLLVIRYPCAGDDVHPAIVARLAVAERLAAASRRLLDATDDALDTAIEAVLGDLLGLTGADRAFAFHLDPRTDTMSATHEVVTPGTPMAVTGLQGIPLDRMPGAGTRLRALQPLRVDDTASADLGVVERAFVEEQGVRSSLIVPQVVAGALAGSVGLEALCRPIVWSDEVVTLLAGVADAIGSALARRRAVSAMLRRERHQQEANDLARRAVIEIDVDAVLDDAVATAAAVLGMARVAVLRTAPGGAPETVASVGRPAVAVASTPLASPEGALGTLEVHAAAPRTLDDDEVLFLEAVGHTIAGALRRRDAEQQLVRAERLDALGLLAGGVAHDFNNLLMTIMGNAELLADGTTDRDPTGEESLRAILAAGRQGAALAGQILSFSRGGLARRAPVDVVAVLDGMRGVLGSLLGATHPLRITGAPATAWISGTASQLEQVVLNLVVNARDAMPGGGAVRLEVEEDGHEVVLTVVDTGGGIAPEVLDRVVEPFFSTKPLGRGTGLGLAMCHGIVESWGGTLDIRSAPGEGTAVRVAIPRAVAGLPGPSDGDRPTTDVAPGATVLVVDDQDAVRSVVARVLARDGHHVLEAVDGLDALAVARRSPTLDLVVTDLAMPHLDGRQLAEVLCADDPDLRVILMSGFAEDPGDGGLPHLQKPFRVGELLGLVRAVLGGVPV